MSVIIALVSGILMLMGIVGLPLVSELTPQQAALVAFALSFSSTVFVVKVLEERGEMASQHGRTAIGILIMQDLVAVLFIVISSAKLPSPWAILLLVLIPLRPLLSHIFARAGHGELVILFGLVLALGGAQAFELVGIKGDLGALIMGVLISADKKSKELADAMLGFKDLFLVGFFLSIGLSSQLDWTSVAIGLALVPIVIIKTMLFMVLMMAFRMRARTSLFASLNLSNYSEFGLIVASLGVASGLLPANWLVVIAVALSGSFLLAAPVTRSSNQLFKRWRPWLNGKQSSERLYEDQPIDTHNAKIAIFGMGRVGSGAYKELQNVRDEVIIGVDHDVARVARLAQKGLNVVVGNPGDPDFWDKVEHNPPFDLVLLALPNLDANLNALEQIKQLNYALEISAVVTYTDEERVLREHGIEKVYNIYSAAGAGFAEHVIAGEPLKSD
jgi:predicted Kef-type K+ transport protein/CheY-like chemotaxis protein